MNCSFASQESPCSSYGSSTNVLPLDACKEDITPHLLGLGVSSKRGWRSEGIEITEKELNKHGKQYYEIELSYYVYITEGDFHLLSYYLPIETEVKIN